ncbi:MULTISPECIES: hypothetical protein [Kosakonia]|uniref:hypothetical protein n=1 Tax=Kosakonia TaxID=1330547 RepID=UPI0013F1673E|nr:hypothetical protein [Kosakonia quasisacchari]
MHRRDEARQIGYTIKEICAKREYLHWKRKSGDIDASDIKKMTDASDDLFKRF